MPPTYKNRRNKQRARSRQYLPHLMQNQERKCHWCGCKLTAVYELPAGSNPVIDQATGLITWEEDGTIQSAKVATIDHVRPLSSGGSGKLHNLVAACVKCNNARSTSSSTRPPLAGGLGRSPKSE